MLTIEDIEAITKALAWQATARAAGQEPKVEIDFMRPDEVFVGLRVMRPRPFYYMATDRTLARAVESAIEQAPKFATPPTPVPLGEGAELCIT